MNILGLMAFGESPAACVVIDGKLRNFCQEERLTRFKGSQGFFPGRAIRSCLEDLKLKLEDIDRIAFGWDATQYPAQMAWFFAREYAKRWFALPRHRPSPDGIGSGNAFSVTETLCSLSPGVLRSRIRDGLREHGLFGDVPRIEFVRHHLAHAYSAYFCSGFDESLVLVVDGSGERQCTTMFLARRDEIRELWSYDIPNSLGWFYAAITAYLGFIAYRDEGKVMGLAALGEARSKENPWVERLQRVVRIGNGHYEVDPTFTKLGGHRYHARFTDELVEWITASDPTMPPIAYGERARLGDQVVSKYLLPQYVDLAWAAQDMLERAAVTLVERGFRETGVRNLCVAGGVGLNCKMNGVLRRRAGVDRIFVQPASSDEGAALGAALVLAHRNGDDPGNVLRHVQYGPGFTTGEIESALRACHVRYRGSSDAAREAASLLGEGKIVGWHQGRMEFGARALGGRSILANPIDAGVKDRVNAQVKYREQWRPFCPSLVADAAGDCMAPADTDAHFMNVAYIATEELVAKAPAIVHVDRTIRPQTVDPEPQSLYYAMLRELKRTIGYPVVLNTSLNVRGEPIACSPMDSLRCFLSTGMDALIIGDFVVQKDDA